MDAEEKERYATQLCLPNVGASGQNILKNASILVVGAGGLGCPVLLYLAAAGIGKIGIVDNDKVSLSNLQRQILYSVDDINKFKCHIAKQKCKKINPHTLFNEYQLRLDINNGATIIQHYDLIIDATDNIETRYAINDLCIAANKPFIYGSINAYEGQVAVFNADTSKTSYRSLFPVPPTPEMTPNCTTGGVIGALAGIVGSIQALEAIKLLLDRTTALSGKLLRINSKTWQISQFKIGDDTPQIESFLLNMNEMQSLINEKPNALIIDVREDQTLPLRFPNAKRIPFSQLTTAPTLPKDQCIVLYCNKGIMSTHATKILRERFAYTQVYGLI